MRKRDAEDLEKLRQALEASQLSSTAQRVFPFLNLTPESEALELPAMKRAIALTTELNRRLRVELRAVQYDYEEFLRWDTYRWCIQKGFAQEDAKELTGKLRGGKDGETVYASYKRYRKALMAKHREMPNYYLVDGMNYGPRVRGSEETPAELLGGPSKKFLHKTIVSFLTGNKRRIPPKDAEAFASASCSGQSVNYKALKKSLKKKK